MQPRSLPKNSSSSTRNARSSQRPSSPIMVRPIEVRPINGPPSTSSTSDPAPKKKAEFHALPSPRISSLDPTFTQTSGLWLVQVATNENLGIHGVTIYHPTTVTKVATVSFRHHSSCVNPIRGLVENNITLRVVSIEVTDSGAVL
jgi:hypothetical protein